MGKVLFVLELPEPKVRKEHAPPSKWHKDANKYSRKQKHKAKREEAPDDSGASFFVGIRRLGSRWPHTQTLSGFLPSEKCTQTHRQRTPNSVKLRSKPC